MERRRRTLDRWQMLGFSRKSTTPSSSSSSSSVTATVKPATTTPTDEKLSNNSMESRKNLEKTERLKELTELLKGNRISVPPPVPPPRKPRSSQIDLSTIPSTTEESTIIDYASLTSSSESPVVLADDNNDDSLSELTTINIITDQSTSLAKSRLGTPLFKESLNYKSIDLCHLDESSSSSSSLKKPPAENNETRLTVTTTNPVKHTPCRSSSFSQVEYSKGKYIRSAFGALKASLKKNKDLLVVDNANLTLPRTKDGIYGSKQNLDQKDDVTQSSDATDTVAALKTTTEHISMPQIKDIPAEIEKTTNLMPTENITLISSDSVMDLTNSIKQLELFESSIQSPPSPPSPPPLPPPPPPLPPPPPTYQHPTLDILQTPEIILMETISSPSSPPKNENEDSPPLQTLLPCIIPLPVYDCVVKDYSSTTTNNPEKNIDTENVNKSTELQEQQQQHQHFETLPINESINKPKTRKNNHYHHHHHHQPQPQQHPTHCSKCHNKTSSSSPSPPPPPAPSTPPPASSPQLPQSPQNDEQIPCFCIRTSVSEEIKDDCIEVVRKRHSREDRTYIDGNNFLPESISSNQIINEDQIKIDKSKRRKGIYIQWPVLDKPSKSLDLEDWPATTQQLPPHSSSLTNKSSPHWPFDSIAENNSPEFNFPSSPAIDDELNRTIAAAATVATTPTPTATIGISQPTTPELEYGSGKLPLLSIWPQSAVTTTITSPSSSSSLPPTASGGGGGSGGVTSGRRKSLTYQSSEEKDIKDDFINPTQSSPLLRSLHHSFLRSDSISDNESEKMLSSRQSPVPNEQDFRRYSKRPLRGPYGQMLEAEMKKPTKMHFDEILEELGKSGGGGGGQIENTKNIENEIPLTVVSGHIRATSTPVQTVNSNTNLIHSHKKFPSSIESSSECSMIKCDPGSTEFWDTSSSECSTTNQKKKLSLDSAKYNNNNNKHHHPHLKSHLTKSSTIADSTELLQNIFINQTTTPTIMPTNVSLNSPATPSSMFSNSESPRTTTGKTPAREKLSMQATPELLAQLLQGSSEKLVTEQHQLKHRTSVTYSLPQAVLQSLDTRTHIVVELFNTEQSYVDSLDTVVSKYLNPLKSMENSGICDTQTVDEIFLMVPSILHVHSQFLNQLKERLNTWHRLQQVGDAFIEVFSKPSVLNTYETFVNNWNKAKDAIRSTRSARPAFSKFLETMAREHKGKLSLDNLLIKPVQKFPNYELILSRLIKHTDKEHPDQKPLQDALKLVHDILLQLNCKEQEAIENCQRESILRQLENIVEGMTDLVTNDRQFLLFDLVSVIPCGPTGAGGTGRKDRGLFLFSDLLILTSIKRRSGTIRKSNQSCPAAGIVAQTLDANKYKFVMKIAIEDIDIVKTKDDNVQKLLKEIHYLSEDYKKLKQIADIASNLRYQHSQLDDCIKDLQREIQRQLLDQQAIDSQLNVLDLTLSLGNEVQHWSVIFPNSEKRTQWEQILLETKQKLVSSMDRHPLPEFVNSIPIRKTRAGLQFTCASPTIGKQKDVWVCNSDGYVGQICVLSLNPEPTVISCNGVCNARILCVASVPICLEHNFQLLSNDNRLSPRIDEHKRRSPTLLFSPTQLKSGSGGCSVDCSSSFSGSAGSGNNQIIEPSTMSSISGSTIIQSPDSNDDSGDCDSDLESQFLPHSISEPHIEQQHHHHHQHQQQQQQQHNNNNNNNTNSDPSVYLDNNFDHQQSTMWLGTEDGCIHVYNCTDNIRIKKNKLRIQHSCSVYSILYLDNRVFVSLANGEIIVYLREQGIWNTQTPLTVTIGNVTTPVRILINVHGHIWCSVQGVIKILNANRLQIDYEFKVSDKLITNMVTSRNYVWISLQNSPMVECYHAISHGLLFQVNVFNQVTKMLSNCDDIIKQHKAACLRVTSLLACKELVWVGTSAGVLLTISAKQNATGSLETPIITGIPHGHTGHVRFLTYVESNNADKLNKRKSKPDMANTLIISGGDGYENFRNTGTNPMSDAAGREDSTNHLLLWQV